SPATATRPSACGAASACPVAPLPTVLRSHRCCGSLHSPVLWAYARSGVDARPNQALARHGSESAAGTTRAPWQRGRAAREWKSMEIAGSEVDLLANGRRAAAPYTQLTEPAADDVHHTVLPLEPSLDGKERGMPDHLAIVLVEMPRHNDIHVTELVLQQHEHG